jgi:hypothetical protein
MARKQTPQWKKGWGGFYTFPYLKDEDFQELEEVLGSKIDKEIRSRLQGMVRDFASDKHFFEDRPRLAQVRAALKSVRDKPESYHDISENLDAESAYELERRLGNASEPKNVDEIKMAAEDALEDLNIDKGGRPKKKAALRTLIIDLSVVFKEITGRNAGITWHQYRERYEGLFYDFISKFLDIVDKDEIWSNSSLGQQIQSALKSAKSSPHQ